MWEECHWYGGQNGKIGNWKFLKTLKVRLQITVAGARYVWHIRLAWLGR